MPKKYDLIGQVFGKLSVLEEMEHSVNSHTMYRCRCTCGKEVVVRGVDLRRGYTRSCGGTGCKKKQPPRELTEGETMGAKKDCFAYLKRQGGAVCTALNEVVCLKQECKFYAPLKEVCSNCQNKVCEKCLTVSYQKQHEKQ